MNARGKADAVGIHDSDVLTYDRRLLALYPVANPNFNFEFCKGYYPRVADGKMNGRVTLWAASDGARACSARTNTCHSCAGSATCLPASFPSAAR